MTIFKRLFNPFAYFNRRRRRGIQIQAFVTVRDKNGKIVAKGKSKKSNLILDNFGTWLAGLISAPSTLDRGVTLKDNANTSRTIKTYADGSVNLYCFNDHNTHNRTIGTQVRVGSGITPAARTDYQIETAFGTAPESGLISTGNGSYSLGNITFSGSITAGGSGTINEAGFYGRWTLNDGATEHTFMLFHDILTTGVPFTPGQSITVEYTISL